MAQLPRTLTGGMYAVTVPADPGWAQPARHAATAPGGGVDRDDASAGGGWQPYAWGMDVPASVLPGESARPSSPGHAGSRSHAGAYGRGQTPRPARELGNPDNLAGTGLHTPETLDLAGASGAANGGISPTGVSAPWANGPVSRRRADGTMISRAGGLALGTDYVRVAETHHQGLHMNRPTIRGVRQTSPVVERSSPSPGGRTSPYDPMAPGRTKGPIAPRLRRIVRPYGQTDYVSYDQDPGAAVDSGTVGGEWVL